MGGCLVGGVPAVGCAAAADEGLWEGIWEKLQQWKSSGTGEEELELNIGCEIMGPRTLCDGRQLDTEAMFSIYVFVRGVRIDRFGGLWEDPTLQ